MIVADARSNKGMTVRRAVRLWPNVRRAKSYVMTRTLSISCALSLISYRHKRNYLLDGCNTLRLAYGHSDGRSDVDAMRR